MPFCNTCGSFYEGRGLYCPYHGSKKTFPKSYEQPSGYYNVDGIPPMEYNSHKHHNRYNSPDLSLFPSRHGTSANLQSAATHFRNLANDYTINNMTFHTHPNGTKSIQVSANKDRVQCSTCKQWFPDRKRLEAHQWEYVSGCEDHAVCFSREDEMWHGTSWKHDRCFVKGCESVYRREGGWKAGVVEDHVRKWHQ
ncbi:hypothetical protein BDV96DRAFT_640521 [Lophiotrema nucula]|uniref:Uncharacterized protein n=1 Tax=Lophiotrema nucula TaxID=690887 RepID=A0A6A5ZPM5_9PLEO|nr:hypothetical protein BDV96DRAFT_640521 [Lophiotrema nucula]